MISQKSCLRKCISLLKVGGSGNGAVLQFTKTLGQTLSVGSQWDMEFNHTTARKAINSVYTLHGQILEVVTVTSAKYLGVDTSGGLSWNSHIDRITGNANKAVGYKCRNIKAKNQKVRETAYNTLVHPQLEYVAAVWDSYTKEKSLQLEKVQGRAARWITNNYDYRSSVTSMLDQLNWRSFEQRQADVCLCLKQNGSWTCGSTPPSRSMSSPHIECPFTATQ